jgi:hypothetical protein
MDKMHEIIFFGVITGALLFISDDYASLGLDFYAKTAVAAFDLDSSNDSGINGRVRRHLHSQPSTSISTQTTSKGRLTIASYSIP